MSDPVTEMTFWTTLGITWSAIAGMTAFVLRLPRTNEIDRLDKDIARITRKLEEVDALIEKVRGRIHDLATDVTTLNVKVL